MKTTRQRFSPHQGLYSGLLPVSWTSTRQGRTACTLHGRMACNGNPGRDEQKESRKTVSGLENVVLAAPDIDTADMIRQLEAIGHLERPLTLLVLKDDGALALSGFVTGGRRRFGADDAYDPWGPIGGKTVWRSGHLCVSSRNINFGAHNSLRVLQRYLRASAYVAGRSTKDFIRR